MNPTPPSTRAWRPSEIFRSVAVRLSTLRASGDRGSETTEKVLWISAIIAVVAVLYPILSGKLQDWFNNLNFTGM